MYLVNARKTYIEVLFGSDLPGGFSGDSWRWNQGHGIFFFYSATITDMVVSYLST